MFEGFNPTPKGIKIIRDYVMGKISLSELVTFAKKRLMSNSYKYIDPEYNYTDPKTRILRNLQGIWDSRCIIICREQCCNKTFKRTLRKSYKD